GLTASNRYALSCNWANLASCVRGAVICCSSSPKLLKSVPLNSMLTMMPPLSPALLSTGAAPTRSQPCEYLPLLVYNMCRPGDSGYALLLPAFEPCQTPVATEIRQ